MSPRVPRLRAREVEALLARHGFRLVSQKGSHGKWRNQAKGLQVIVPHREGRQLPLGALRSILLNAEIPEAERERQARAPVRRGGRRRLRAGRGYSGAPLRSVS